MSVKQEVKIALVKKGWSQRELARQMDISITYLQDILNEVRRPEERLKQIENILGIDLKKEA
ncbi:helix-turn-helix transcriptional regulator [Tetragenococcus koreensis]|uniref:helix-turn-helix domain-containing protein n=1 Tax=Tetragenococcus koreensis TaxID=290335 RepID=UPI001F3D0ACB|nr:helix-turn-helix transcriptional regulator [Tetragenococcus koreensis]MCF1614818.1 helix-turn-helix transcriptional regulator [Tetragenococcus koreensis]MCF1624618.1 helix-turn-helix transcriptional regulator [Tetragenococcus koreensis]